MALYLGTKFTTARGSRSNGTFACTVCGHRQRCIVVGVGEGNSPYFFDNPGARARAEFQAASAAERDAENALALTRCPTCRSHNVEAVAWFWAKHVTTMLLLVLAGVAGSIFLMTPGDPGPRWISALTGLGAAGLVLYLARLRWGAVEGKVRFIEPEPKPRPRVRRPVEAPLEVQLETTQPIRRRSIAQSRASTRSQKYAGSPAS
ncbi:MAG: hypothetical protein AAF721_02350 [Myxococcota bacterium]